MRYLQPPTVVADRPFHVSLLADLDHAAALAHDAIDIVEQQVKVYHSRTVDHGLLTTQEAFHALEV
jgi:hypothetical protein